LAQPGRLTAWFGAVPNLSRARFIGLKKEQYHRTRQSVERITPNWKVIWQPDSPHPDTRGHTSPVKSVCAGVECGSGATSESVV